MKLIFPVALLVLFFAGATQASSVNLLQSRNGVAFEVNQLEPFTGTYVKSYHSGKKALEISYKDGIKNGVMTKWYPDGKKAAEVYFRNNVEDGLNIEWYSNGVQKYEAHYKNGAKTGAEIEWDENGQKLFKLCFKEGQLEPA